MSHRRTAGAGAGRGREHLETDFPLRSESDAAPFHDPEILTCTEGRRVPQ